jgi:hypothetical protein
MPPLFCLGKKCLKWSGMEWDEEESGKGDDDGGALLKRCIQFIDSNK